MRKFSIYEKLDEKKEKVIGYYVQYEGGTSRNNPDLGVDYMICKIDGDNEDIELYAEAVNPTWNEEKQEYGDGEATFNDLKTEIIRQAEEKGVDVRKLIF